MGKRRTRSSSESDSSSSSSEGSEAKRLRKEKKALRKEKKRLKKSSKRERKRERKETRRREPDERRREPEERARSASKPAAVERPAFSLASVMSPLSTGYTKDRRGTFLGKGWSHRNESSGACDDGRPLTGLARQHRASLEPRDSALEVLARQKPDTAPR